MNATTLSVNLLIHILFFSFNYAYSEDILLGSDFKPADSELQISDSKSETFEPYKDPNFHTSNLNDKTSTLGSNYDSSYLTQSPGELRFFTLIPGDNKKVVELTRDRYTFKVDESNHEVFNYEFSDNATCAKIKYDDTTIWRSGDYDIEGAKFVIYNKNNDRIVVRDDERSITYRLVDDSPDQEEALESATTESDLTDSNKLGPFDSAVTYVAYVTDPFKDFRRSKISVALVLFSLFALLVLMTLMLIGLLLLVVRLYKVVDQIKFDIGSTDTKVVF